MDIVLRALFAFALITLLIRVMGRREISTMEPFDLVLLIVIGDLVQQGVTQSDYSLTGLVLAGGTFALLTTMVSYGVFRVARLRPLFRAEPLVLVEDGRLIERNLRRERITAEEVAAEVRMNQLSSLDEVRWAVLESNGKISVIPR